MFGMFNRKSVNSAEAIPEVQELCWNALIAKEDGYLSAEWGKARYDKATDTVSMQYVVNNLDGTAKTVVKNNLAVVEALSELATLRQRANIRSWNYLENTWQGSLKAAMEAVQVSANFSVSITHPPVAINGCKDMQEIPATA